MSASAAVSIAGARVLITGGAGLVGSTIADALLPYRPAEIVVLDDLSRGRLANLQSVSHDAPLRLIQGDVRDPSTVAAAMAGVDLVFHEAAIRITHCAEDPRLAFEVLGTGTFNVVEAAVAAGVQKVVAASSASIYGDAEVLPTDERHHPWNNRTLYGALKVFNEGLLRSFHEMSDLDYVMLRYFNVYGPRMDTCGVYTEVLIRWMERIEAGLPPIILGDGHQTMDFVHVADVAQANVLAAEAPVTDEVFNVATGESTSLSELAALLIKVMESDVVPTYGPARRTNAVAHRRATVTKAAALLGFRSRIDLVDGLTDLVAWWRANRVDALDAEPVAG
jgi:UDP-glucose 4-epimerase